MNVGVRSAFRLTAVDQAAFQQIGPDVLEIRLTDRRMRLKRLDKGVLCALAGLAAGPADRDRLREYARSVDPAADLRRLDQELARLASRSALELSCVANGQPVLRAVATSRLAAFDLNPAKAGQLRLSRLSVASVREDVLVVEALAAYTRVCFLDPALGGLLTALATARDLPGIQAALPGHDPELIEAAVTFLLGTGAIVAVDQSGDSGESRHRQRELPDVALHARSRQGLSDQRVGGTFRFAGELDPAPALRARPDGPGFALPKPDLDRLRRTDRSLTDVQESRRSIRQYGPDPITLAQLGEFLYRVARCRTVHPVDESIGLYYEVSDRPYPSGGGAYDLELYLTLPSCPGLPPGMYHYAPDEHLLTLVCDRPEVLGRMLRDASTATGGQQEPPVLITLASRFARLSWKYEGLAYATALKNVGVLYHAMYLAATAMRLAPCALGTGDAATFSEATGCDPLVESSVGEFALGSRASDGGERDVRD
ncbi:SagB family peptide dehydrogenase [Fodinicola acaciae]|uniref:SagB family peptide dehydrogenase n=1 Tax=Fodinicola acaciae TaxID=2681555 RepID=UPI0013D5E195|nr:SagB family peptide dehydrogenase [Fodinicola acaciae]